MFKFSLPVLFGLVLCLPVTAFANLDQPLQALDDHALSAEYGQSNTLSTRSIPFYCARSGESSSI